MKKAIAVALILALVVIGVPILIPGMASGHCSDCGPAVAASGLCLMAFLAAAIGAITLTGQLHRERRRRYLELLRAAFFDQPPQPSPVF